MEARKRIPLHNHFDSNSGGRIAGQSVTGLPALPAGANGEHEHEALADDHFKYLGHWEPVTDGDVATPEMVFEDGDIVMEWVTP